MSFASQSAVKSWTQIVDFYFEIALYFLVATGFAVLASTGGLDLPSTILMIAALLLRGFSLSARRQFIIAERWTTPLTLVYFVFFAADYFALSRAFLPATIHLALFAVAVRMFSLRRDRDHVMLAILSFLMVLAAAVLTVDSMFLFSFAAFLLMAVATFVLLEMRRSGQSATLNSRQSHEVQDQRQFAASLARMAPGLMLLILLGAGVLFFLLPRHSGGYLGGYAFGTDFSSGFSDHVQLGQIGRIQQSNTVVMHVQVEGDHTGRYDLRWRGVALADFDGHTWSKPRDQYPLEGSPESGFAIPHPAQSASSSVEEPATPRPKIIHYRVLMEPIGTNVFFVAPWARSLSGVYQLLATDNGGAVYNLDLQHAVSRYEAISDISTPTADQLRNARQDYPDELDGDYFRLRMVDPRVRRLAEQITSSAKTEFDKASAIETYLRTRYQYTLELPRATPEDPIANFLFERKQGHCEYFASAMAVMLRTLHIPSRVVNGFRSDEFNDVTGNYVVRAKDAHAWVEAYFPGYGWQTFDPTPGGGSSIPQGWARVMLYVDAMSSFWRDWIVSYDTSHQYVIGQSALIETHNLWERSRAWSRKHYESILLWAHRTQDEAQHSPTRWILVAIILSVSFLLVRNLKRILQLVREYRLRRHPERSPELAASMWYSRMTRSLARSGLEKVASETPQDFLQRISDSNLREPISRFTEVYESARFGNSAEDAGRLPELCEEVETAARRG
ncbi:MAG TPA: DUF3488 and transglutaminase-like domain-containing protein [Candidatus Sulfotelmatobacter sp.]|nr:DUF3488 and transglutaminase-like domain-containing protein [Candidatus Sulfotelmatobacter sp.]